MGLFGHVSSHLFRSAYFRKEISYEGHLFFENVLNLMQISKMKEEIDKKVFVFEIMRPNWYRQIVSIKKRILVISTQCVNKQL